MIAIVRGKMKRRKTFGRSLPCGRSGGLVKTPVKTAAIR
jgi:hypothetical protein